MIREEKCYNLTAEQAANYKHPHPRRTASIPLGDDQRLYRIFPSRKAMIDMIRKQQARGARDDDFRPVVELAEDEAV